MKPDTQTPNLSTVQELIEAVAQRLEQAQAQGRISFGHGTNNAFDEAAWLCLWALQYPIDDLDAVSQQSITAAQQQAAYALLAQRLDTRKPLAYLTQEAWLQGLSFYIDERSIVPRSLLAECLAEGELDPWLSTDSGKALDLCTGNGSLAILCALAYPQWHIDACDISTKALDVARINRERYELAARVRLFQSDGLAACTGPYDLILCNPPYVNQDSMQSLPAEYRHEPSLALAGGDDGMHFIRPMLAQAASFLSPQGVLVLEIGNEYAHFVSAFPTLEGIWLDTSAGDDQVVLLQREQLALLS